MVRKIQASEYLKRYGNMPAVEKQDYLNRVGQWLQTDGRSLMTRADDADAMLQDVTQVSVKWNDVECAAFERGAILLSALMNTSDTWLPDMLYVKAAKRAIRQMVKILSALRQGNKQKEDVKSVAASPSLEITDEQKERIVEKYTNKVSKKQVEKRADTDSTGVPTRPKHIDQYIHLMPKKTQEHAGQVRELLRGLDDAREKCRLLMGSPQASADSRAQWAKKAVQLDNKLKDIYAELDNEWEKLVKQGRVVVDIFGNASVVEDNLNNQNNQGIQSAQPELTPEQKTRRRDLRKWLTDTRRGVDGKSREKRIELWKENWKEYLTLEPIEDALQDEKIVAAAAHYGIQIIDN